MQFDLKEVIKISEYVRVSSKSCPNKKTKSFVDDYLETKKIQNNERLNKLERTKQKISR